jgi:hypothetical protein
MPAFDPKQEHYLRETLEMWEPRNVHCSNCAHAKVSGNPVMPLVSCAKNWGKGQLYLIQLCRHKNPHGFRNAVDCQDFESMGPGTDRRR